MIKIVITITIYINNNDCNFNNNNVYFPIYISNANVKSKTNLYMNHIDNFKNYSNIDLRYNDNMNL